jgi:hypothetical protein
MAEKPNLGRADTALAQMTLPLGFDAWMEMNRPTLAAMAQMNTKVYDGISALNRNWAAFVNRRLKEGFAMPQHLAGCKTVQDFYGVYSEFFQTACADYQAEFEQLTKLGKSLADDTLHTVRSSVEEATRSVAEHTRPKAA